MSSMPDSFNFSPINPKPYIHGCRLLQRVTTLFPWGYVKAEEIGTTSYLAFTERQRAFSPVYRWNGVEFTEYLTLATSGATALVHFVIDGVAGPHPWGTPKLCTICCLDLCAQSTVTYVGLIFCDSLFSTNGGIRCPTWP